MNIKLTHYQNLKLQGLLPRDLWVWTPRDYECKPDFRFPVIYMHDGQNLFDPKKSYTHITWGIAETITKLSAWGFIQPAIVVGIDNTINRIGDYMPTRPFDSPEGKAFISAALNNSPKALKSLDYVADLYLQLMVEKIKPLIDEDFRTLTDRQNTLVMGSSMGGLISLYALVAYPEIFGGAGCFSTHWPAINTFLVPYLQENMPEPGKHRFYYDLGTGGGDAEYLPYQQLVDGLMREKGYKHGKDWLTRVAPGADHHECAWRSRIHVALRFFLGSY